MVRTALVGRDGELAELVGCLTAARAGRPRVVVCRGEPGIGKTRLAEEVVAAARKSGVASAWGRAADAAGAPPYWPWRQALRALEVPLGLADLAAGQGFGADLGGLAPEVFGGAAESDEPASSEDRFRRFDAIAQVLRLATARSAALIVFDDAHWADRGSLLLLQHVVRGLTDERLLVLVNYRDTDETDAPSVAALLREPAAQEIALRGLTTSAVAERSAQVTGHLLNATEAAHMRELTGGNPFFVGELARSQVDGGSLSANVREAIAARVARLPPECARVLTAGSIVGREFAVPVVAQMTDLPVPDCLAALDRAVAAGLLELGTGPGELRFVHALVRDAIEAGISTLERIRLHRAAADALEQLHARHVGPHLFDLARHWAAAAVTGDGDRAATWIVRAAEEAMVRLAYEDAARLYHQALQVGRGLEPTERFRVLIAAAVAHNRADDLVAGLAACTEAAAIVRSIDRPDLLVAVALAAEPVWEPRVRWFCEAALTSVGTAETPVRAQLTAKYAETFIYGAETEAARPVSEQALEMAARCGEPRVLAAALRARNAVCAGPDDLAEREELAERMLAISRTNGAPDLELTARLWRVDTALERGDLAAVAAEIDRLTVCAREVRGPFARFKVLQCQATLAQAQARFADARRLVAEAFALGHPEAFFMRAAILGLMGRHVGFIGECLDAVGMAGAPEGVEAPVIGAVSHAAGLVGAGRVAEAATVFRALGPVAAWRTPAHVELCARMWAMDVAIALGDATEVAALHDKLAPYRGHHAVSGIGAMGYNGPVELWLGCAARFLGRHDDAVADLERAVRTCAVNGAAGYRVEAQLELAAALLGRGGRGDDGRAAALVADCAREAGRLGMPPLVARARGLMRDPGQALTPREREVAELVAQGLTNREIATRLYLSERTAQNHVQHILTKLDLPNRGQIALWVAHQAGAGSAPNRRI